jgi:hypothetical protein
VFKGKNLSVRCRFTGRHAGPDGWLVELIANRLRKELSSRSTTLIIGVAAICGAFAVRICNASATRLLRSTAVGSVAGDSSGSGEKILPASPEGKPRRFPERWWGKGKGKRKKNKVCGYSPTHRKPM